MEPYLDGVARDLFDAWHAGLVERFSRDLTFPEIRRGVQALSSLYVGRRGSLADRGAAAFDGAGKRAGFALYFAPLHFLTVYHALREIGFDGLPVTRLWDLGCGTGAGGAAWAAAQRTSATLVAPATDPSPFPGLKVIGVDRSGFALEETAAAWRAFGVKGETKRIVLGAGDAGGERVVRIGKGPAGGGAAGRRRGAGGGLRGDDAVLLAYTLNEIDDASRTRLLDEIVAGGRTSRPLLIVEPVARKVTPWWSRWERALGEEALSVHSLELRRRIALPPWLASMDSAAGLDHGELTARVLGVIG
jgi:hypothetical protein